MLEFLADNIFVVFAGKVFQQTVGIPMGTNCAPSSRRHLSVFIRSRIHTVFALNRKETVSISVQSHLHVHRWCIVHKQEFKTYLGQMYPAEFEIKNSTESATSAPLGGMVNFTLPFMTNQMISISIWQTFRTSSNVPFSPAYGVYIYELIRNAWACSSNECLILRDRRLSSKLLKQGYLVERLKSSFRKINGRYGDLIQQYEVSLSQMLNDILNLDQ